MVPPVFRRPDPTIAALYGAIVAQARDPRFYEAYRVPDTVLGRFDLIVLHLALVLRRLRESGAGTRALAQGVFDAFCRDMDHNLREMGISDQGVPRQMRRVGEAFYGRAQAYDAALRESGDGALAQALVRNVYAEASVPQVAAAQLAVYARHAVESLDCQGLEALVRGAVHFPEPAAILAPVAEFGVMSAAERPWSAVVRLDEVGETGRHVELEASEPTRAALAKPAAVDGVERAAATFYLTRRGRDGLCVSGAVRATVRQTCVVTLEPVVNEIDEVVDVEFVPAPDVAGAGTDEVVLTQSADEREPLLDGTVDLGALATEFLILGVDPYPRKAGATFEAPKAASDAAGHAFAALAALRKRAQSSNNGVSSALCVGPPKRYCRRPAHHLHH